MTPHILDALIGGIPVAFIAWAQGRDIRTRLVLKVEEHDRRLESQESQLRDVNGRVNYLEGKTNGKAHGANA